MSSPTTAIQPTQSPYLVSYMKNGEKVTLRRRPPPVQHNMLPTDVVELTHTKNADFKAGDKLTVKYISPRSPNTLQVTDKDGNATFVAYYDLELKERVAARDGVEAKQLPQNNRYLTWP